MVTAAPAFGTSSHLISDLGDEGCSLDTSERRPRCRRWEDRSAQSNSGLVVDLDDTIDGIDHSIDRTRAFLCDPADSAGRQDLGCCCGLAVKAIALPWARSSSRSSGRD
jgi:hypothetical protein